MCIYFASLHTPFSLPPEGMRVNQPIIMTVGTLTWILAAGATVYIFLMIDRDDLQLQGKLWTQHYFASNHASPPGGTACPELKLQLWAVSYVHKASRVSGARSRNDQQLFSRCRGAPAVHKQSLWVLLWTPSAPIHLHPSRFTPKAQSTSAEKQRQKKSTYMHVRSSFIPLSWNVHWIFVYFYSFDACFL